MKLEHVALLVADRDQARQEHADRDRRDNRTDPVTLDALHAVGERIASGTAVVLPLKPGNYVKVSVIDEGIGIATLAPVAGSKRGAKRDGT